MTGVDGQSHGASEQMEIDGNVEQDGSTDMKGFEFSESSGMYYNSDLGCYYDPKQQLYRDASSGRWYRFENGGYLEVAT